MAWGMEGHGGWGLGFGLRPDSKEKSTRQRPGRFPGYREEGLQGGRAADPRVASMLYCGSIRVPQSIWHWGKGVPGGVPNTQALG